MSNSSESSTREREREKKKPKASRSNLSIDILIQLNKHTQSVSLDFFINIQRIVSVLYNYSWLNTTNRQDPTYQTLKERKKQKNNNNKMSKYFSDKNKSI